MRYSVALRITKVVIARLGNFTASNELDRTGIITFCEKSVMEVENCYKRDFKIVPCARYLGTAVLRIFGNVYGGGPSGCRFFDTVAAIFLVFAIVPIGNALPVLPRSTSVRDARALIVKVRSKVGNGWYLQSGTFLTSLPTRDKAHAASRNMTSSGFIDL